MGERILWGMVVLFVVLSGVLLSGKGGFLIAGYNTASKAEQAKYDEKKLCRVSGACMAVITVLLIIMAVFMEKAPGPVTALMFIGTIVDVTVCLALSNTICVKKDVEKTGAAVKESNAREEQKNKKVVIGTWVFTVLTFLIVGVLLVTGDVKVNFDDDGLVIVGSYWSDKEIAYNEIKSVELMEDEDFQFGSRNGGFGSFKLNEGRFENEQFGRYTLYAYIKCKNVVAIETEEGIIAVNAESPEETEELYRKILERVK